MKFFYLIPIVIGFGIDVIDFLKWLITYSKRRSLLKPSFGLIPIFVLPAWGISGLMIFGKPPQEILKVWNLHLLILLLAFCVHVFILIGLPYLVIILDNLYHGRKLLDRG